jgi:hypothetical protein
MNMGTSFLVAPINHASSKAMQNIFADTKEFLQTKNEMYLKALNPDDDEDAEDGGSNKGAASGRAGGGNAARLKKSPSQIKTEYLSKLFQANQGGKTIHDRPLHSPHATLTKKL